MSKLTENHSEAASDFLSAAHARLLGHTELQFDLASFHQPPTPAWLVALGHFLERFAPELKWGFWIVVALIGAAVLYVFVRQAVGLRWRRVPRGVAPPAQIWRPAPDKARLLLHDADALAAAGRFAEAAHLILLRSIQDIEERYPRLVRPAFTAREIGRLEPLPATARATFAGIANLVERALFAGGRIDAEDFARAREDYERFAFPENWRAPA